MRTSISARWLQLHSSEKHLLKQEAQICDANLLGIARENEDPFIKNRKASQNSKSKPVRLLRQQEHFEFRVRCLPLP
jgi:hypothetical protein